VFVDQARIHAMLERNAPHHLGQVLHVAAYVFAIRRQVQHRVANQLPWRVQRDVTAASCVHHFYAQLCQLFSRGQQVLGVGPAPESDHGRVLDEQYRVVNAAGRARRVQSLLQRQAG